MSTKTEDIEQSFDYMLDIINLDDANIKYYKAFLESKNNLFKAKNILEKWDRDEKRYGKELKKLADLLYKQSRGSKLTDEQIIDYIAKYIELSFKYEENNCTMYEFITGQKGQCYHIAHLFRDLLIEFGYHAFVIKGYDRDDNLHEWNKIILNNEEFYFDLTYEITGAEGQFHWISYDEMLETHAQIITVR